MISYISTPIPTVDVRIFRRKQLHILFKSLSFVLLQEIHKIPRLSS